MRQGLQDGLLDGARGAARKDPSGFTVTRIGTVFTSVPTSPSADARFRLATGVPTTRSVCPVWRWRRTSKAASMTM